MKLRTVFIALFPFLFLVPAGMAQPPKPILCSRQMELINPSLTGTCSSMACFIHSAMLQATSGQGSELEQVIERVKAKTSEEYFSNSKLLLLLKRIENGESRSFYQSANICGDSTPKLDHWLNDLVEDLGDFDKIELDIESREWPLT